ncbi:hypothetical protein L218DRAFT_956258 [Marasmius fiardii PR-910]|nr:hypothetical protein L218DRAFT_956258 [Marasmius fiardii PR-910]
MHIILVALAVSLTVGPITASSWPEIDNPYARPEHISSRNSEIHSNRRLSRHTTVYARHSRATSSMSSTHHVRVQLSHMDTHDASPHLQNTLGVVKGKEISGRVNLISDGRIFAHIYHDSSTDDGEVDIDAKDATTFNLVYLDSSQLPYDDSLAYLTLSGAKCLTLSWSTPRLALEDCYSLTEMKEAATHSKTQVYRFNRSSSYIFPVAYCAPGDASTTNDVAEQSKIDTSDGTRTTTAAFTSVSSSIHPSLSPGSTGPAEPDTAFSTSTTSSEHQSIASRSVSAFDPRSGPEGVTLTHCSPDEFYRIPVHEFWDIYPWRFDSSS